MSLLIEHEKTGDVFYTGPLDPAVRATKDDRVLTCGRESNGVWFAYLSDVGETLQLAEWGRGSSPDEALRYALGAYFGPIDEFYDEEFLQGLLKAGK